ncbi:unnamed protein product [Linum trigynum]
MFRIQLWDVQEECCTQRFGRTVASATLGRVLEAGVYSCADSGHRFIKIKALIDFSKPLRSQVMATNEETGEFWIRLKYEYLPSFFYRCGRVGHLRQDCSFDPPTRRERFGHHMSTKKLGRRVFEEEESVTAFHGNPKSVWVNTAAQDRRVAPAGLPRPSENKNRREAEIMPRPVIEEKPLWMGTSTQPFLTTEARNQVGRNPIRVSITKSPNIRLGRQGRRGKLRKASESAPMEVLQRNVEPQLTRRRRLILEEESEDEFHVQTIPSPSLACPLNEAIRVAKTAALANNAGGAPSPVPNPGSIKKKGRKVKGACSPNKASRKAKPNALKSRKIRRVIVSIASSKNAGPKRVEVLAADSPALVEPVDRQPAVAIQKGVESEESFSGADDQSFEIHRRETLGKGKFKRLAHSSLVRQVVEAFEAGLTMSDPTNEQGLQCPLTLEDMAADKGVPKEDDLIDKSFNKYGSNLGDLEGESKKRRINEVDGDIADSPSPKKLFVEDKDELEMVEVASRDWPHPDK